MKSEKTDGKRWWKIYWGGYDYTVELWYLLLLPLWIIGAFLFGGDIFLPLGAWLMTVSYIVPAVIFNISTRQRDKALSRIRAYYFLALENLSSEEEKVKQILKKIRRMEKRLSLTASPFSRRTLTGIAILFSAPIFATGIFFVIVSEGENGLNREIQNFVNDPVGGMIVYSMIALMPSYLVIEFTKSFSMQEWASIYGDRLQNIIDAGKNVVFAQQENPISFFHGLTPFEVFGLEAGFTKIELRNAWLRLVRELHPDHWQSHSKEVRQQKENALKHVNALYGHLSRS